MSAKHKFGNVVLSLALSLLYFRWVRDSQSGMWIFYRDALDRMSLRSNLMAFSEEIKIEAMRNPAIGFLEIPINYSNRKGGVITLTPGLYGLSNHLLDTPWPKSVRDGCTSIRKVDS